MILFVLLISAALLILIKASKSILIMLGFVMILWGIIYANIYLDGSYQNWDWALQIIIIAFGFIALSSTLNQNISH